MSLLPWVPYLPLIAIGLVAVILWIVALVIYVRRRPKSGDKGLDAEVYDYTTYTGRGGQTMYRAAYRAVVDGRTVTGHSFIARSRKSPPIGTRVKALFRRGGQPELVQGGIVRHTVSLILVGVSVLLVPPALFASHMVRELTPELDHASDIANGNVPTPITSPSSSTASAQSSPQKLPLAKLTSLTDRQLVDVPPFQGAVDHFDPVANIDWARAVATAWAPDAYLYEFHGHLNRDGSWDVTKLGLRYSFLSPARLRAASDEQALVALDLVITPMGVYAIPASSPTKPALPAVSCTLASALAAGTRANKLGDAEHLDAQLSTPIAGYKHAVWSIQPAAKQYPGFYVDAQACKLVE